MWRDVTFESCNNLIVGQLLTHRRCATVKAKADVMIGSFLAQTTLFLAAAVFAAPIAKRLGIGSVLGYLFAGIAIGPYGFGLIYSVYQVDSILHFAEFGVVILLFLIGLELRPKRLWTMRGALFGAGGAQFAITGVLLCLLAVLAGLERHHALLVGLALALSSTAFAIQVLEEKQELRRRHGRLALSVLIFQDIAAIPLIALVPIFAAGAISGEEMSAPGAFRILATVAVVILAGRYLVRMVYPLVAATGVREAMTASALLIVAAVALVMQSIGLSPALGGFLAGVLLADSEFRHEIQADIDPFGGLLMGLFFTAIGMSLNLQIVLERPHYILGAVLSLIVVKAGVLYLIGRWQNLPPASSRRFSISISQGGEFAFVIFTAAFAAGILSRDLMEFLTVVVTLSMIATPLLLLADEKFVSSRNAEEQDFDQMPDEVRPVVIAGFGRFGQIAARIFRAKKIPFTALDSSIAQINVVRKFGARIYYGDPSRVDILRAAQISNARAFVLAVDDVEASIRIASVMRKHFAHVPVFARAHNRNHAHRLMDEGVKVILRETFLSALDLTGDVLRDLGISEREVRHTLETFKEHDQRLLYEQYEHYTDDERMRARTMKANEELEALFAEDARTHVTETEKEE